MTRSLWSPPIAPPGTRLTASAEQIQAITSLSEMLLSHAGRGDKKEAWREMYHELAINLAQVAVSVNGKR